MNKMYRLNSKLLIYVACLSSSAAFAQQIRNTNAAAFGGLGYRPGCAPTAAFQREMTRIMIEEANRFARQMNLPEELPITETNARAIVATPSWYIRRGQIGSIDTRKFSYHVDVGKGVAGVDWLRSSNQRSGIDAKYTWPVSRLDTNAAFREASQIMRAADADVDALNRDAAGCIEINAAIDEGTNVSHFVPIYSVTWRDADTNQSPRAYPNGRLLAFVVFLEPTKAIQELGIFRPKYISRRALESPDLVALLTSDPTLNPREAVLREIEAGTNAAVRRQILLEEHAPESLLKKGGMGATNASPRTNSPAKTNAP